MSLYSDPRTVILADINTRNALGLKMDQVTFDPAQKVSDIVPAPTTTKNSASVMRALPTAPYNSNVRVFFDRLDFATVFANTPVNTYAKLRAFRPARIHDLIPALNDYYGLSLTAVDIVDGPLTLVDGVGTAVIKATPGSIGWMGEFTVGIMPGDLKLEKAITVTDLNGVDYPSGQTEKGQAEVYSYYHDASGWADFLEAIVATPEGVDVTQSVVDFVAELTGDPWVIGNGDYSLNAAKIIYNDSNSLNKPSNHNYDYVFEIQLSASCLKLAGILRFHYNRQASIDNVTTMQSLSVQPDGLLGYSSADDGRARYNPYLETAYNDYTPSANQLKNLPWQSTWTAATVANQNILANALKAVDGRPWTVVAGQPTLSFNLSNVYISYNGPIANAPRISGMDEFRDGFTHVMYFNPPYQDQGNLWYGVGVVYYNL